MRTTTCLLAIVLAGAATAHEAHYAADSVELLTTSTTNFVQSLTEEQREAALFPMDSDERENIRTTPFGAKGVSFADLMPGQIALVHTMLNAGLSATGYHKAASIIALEEYLVELERAQGSVPRVHGTDKYSVAVFGAPEPEGTWAWRIHGHHLYLSFTVVDGKAFAGGPAFYGAEPHRVTEGPREGWSVLAAEENLGKALMDALSEDGKKKAVIADEMPPDMFSGSKRELDFIGEPKGIAYKDLSADKKEMLERLVMEYVHNLPPDQIHTRIEKIEKGGWDNVHFAWIGSTTIGERNYYRVQGREFLIEYCAVALSENHIHTVWREFNGDFGRDILAEHYQNHDH